MILLGQWENRSILARILNFGSRFPMKKTFILLISILLSACGNESHVSEKEPLTERANIEQFTSNIEKCKAQKYKHIRVASDISECALKSIDTYKYSVIK